MRVTIRTLSKKQLFFEVEHESTVLDLKEMLFKREGVPAERQRFIFFGEELDDANLLVDYNVKHKSILHVVYTSEDPVERSNSMCSIF